MIRTSVTLDLTKYDASADARRRRIFAALSACDDGTLVRLVVDHDAFHDSNTSLIAAMTLDCDVEVTGEDPRDVRRYAQLFGSFQRQRRNAETGVTR